MHHNNFGNFYTREMYAIPIPIGFIPIPIPIMSRMAIPMGFPWEWDSHGVSHSHAHLYCKRFVHNMTDFEHYSHRAQLGMGRDHPWVGSGRV